MVSQEKNEVYLKMACKMWRKYKFDYVYDEFSSNYQMFEISCKYYIDKFLQGYNSSLFTYGQTGTGTPKPKNQNQPHPLGKTYSMGI